MFGSLAISAVLIGNETLRRFSCLKDKVTPERTMSFHSEIKRWQCVWLLSLEVHPIQKKFVRQQSFKKSTVSTDRAKPLASNRKAAGNSLFGTSVMWPFCIFLRSPLVVNFHKKKMWALKVEKDGHDPNTFSSLKRNIKGSDNLWRKIFSLFFSRSLSLSVYYFSIYC